MVKPVIGKIGKSGVVAIPPHMRSRFGIKEGDLVVAEEREDGVLFRRIDSANIADVIEDWTIGETGAALTSDVWSAEDFSDWENESG